MSAAKTINLTSATGAGVCVIVLGMAVFMIAKSAKILKNINQDCKEILKHALKK